MPEFVEVERDRPSLKTPLLHLLEDDATQLNDYLDDPTDPVLCVPEQDHDHYWRLLNSGPESSLGGPGSTMNFWQLLADSERLTLGIRMHSVAAFLSMPNSDGVVLGGNSGRGFNDNSVRGYPLRLTLTTTDVVMYDEEILSVKGGRMVKDDQQVPADEEVRNEQTRKTCALRHLDGYPDTKVIDPIKENYPACTVPLSATTQLHVTPEILCNRHYAQCGTRSFNT